MVKKLKIAWEQVIIGIVIGVIASQFLLDGGGFDTSTAKSMGTDLCRTELGSSYSFDRWVGVGAGAEACWIVACKTDSGTEKTICVQLDGHADCP